MNKILPLQSLRAILCLIVVIVHFTPYEKLYFHNHYLAGIAVLGFFILSGYVLTLNYYEKIINQNNLFSFIKKRFFRLFPLHLFFLILFLFLEFLKYQITIGFNLKINSEIFEYNNLYTFLSNLFLINTLNNYLSFNLPSWAVSAEFLSSIIFGFFILIFKKKFLIIAYIIFLFIIFFFLKLEYNLIQYNGYLSLLSCLACYFLGCVLYSLSNNKYLIFLLSNYSIQFFNFVILLFVLKYNYSSFIVIFNFFIIIFFLIRLDNKSFFFKIITNKLLIKIGNISYSIYLSHYFIYWLVTQLFRHILKIETLDSYVNSTFIIQNYNIYLIKLFISIILTIILSIFVYIFVEKKFEIKKLSR